MKMIVESYSRSLADKMLMLLEELLLIRIILIALNSKIHEIVLKNNFDRTLKYMSFCHAF